jgi:hypothetical protein
MIDIFSGIPDDDTGNLLLGYDCHEGYRLEVEAYLKGLTPEKYATVAEWAPYSLYGVLVSAESVVVDQMARNAITEGEQTAEQSLEQLGRHLGWLSFIGDADRLAWLKSRPPQDGIGEGDVSNKAWMMVDGGRTDKIMGYKVRDATEVITEWARLLEFNGHRMLAPRFRPLENTSFYLGWYLGGEYPRL